MMRDDVQCFLDAIIDEPNDDVHRLVYADFIDERGYHERAELIRVQCELEATPQYITLDAEADVRWNNQASKAKIQMANRRYTELAFRERELLAWACDRLVPAGWVALSRRNNLARSCVFIRGFIAEVECNWPDWNSHADNIVLQNPVKEARLLTMPEPIEGDLKMVGHYQIATGRKWFPISDFRRDPLFDAEVKKGGSYRRARAAWLLEHTWPMVGKFILPEAEATHA